MHRNLCTAPGLPQGFSSQTLLSSVVERVIWLPVTNGIYDSGSCERCADDGNSLFLYPLEMPFTQKAFGINLVNIFSTRGTGCKPSVFRNHFEPPDLGIIPRRTGQFCRYGFTSKFLCRDKFRREFCQHCSLVSRGWSVNPRIIGFPELIFEFPVVISRVFAGPCGNFTGEEVHDDAVLVCCPYRPGLSEKRSACALFSSKPV